MKKLLLFLCLFTIIGGGKVYADDMYRIAGTENLTGHSWSTDYNDMSLSDGVYTWTKEVSYDGSSDYLFRIIKSTNDGSSWDWNWQYTPTDGNFNIKNFFNCGSGTYTVRISMIPSTNTTYAMTVNCTSSSVFTVAGSSKVFGTKWDISDNDNNMEQSVYGHSFTKYTLTKSNVLLYYGQQFKFKVVKDHNWSVAHPSTSDVEVNVSEATGYYTVTINYWDNSDNPSCTLTRTGDASPADIYTVAGNQTLMGCSWDVSDTDNQMTFESGNYKLAKSNVELTSGSSYEYKVCKNNGWTGAKGAGEGNASVTAPSYSGTLTTDNYFVEFSFDGTNDPSAYALMQVKGVSLSQSDDIVGEKVTQNLRVSDGSVTINRTLHKGYWNTICLPTDMSETDLNTAFGSGKWKLAEFTGCTDNNMNFSSVSSISNNKPYLLWLDESATNNTSFTVNTDWLSRDDDKLIVNPGDAGYKMIGTMAPTTNLATNCLIIKEDKVYKSTGSSKVNAMSAYFEIPANTPAREFSFSVNGETTGIKFVVTGDKVENDNCKIYDLQGRQVENMQRGVYVVNGKKYVK